MNGYTAVWMFALMAYVSWLLFLRPRIAAKSLTDFKAAPKQVSLWLVLLSIVGTVVGSGTFLAIAGMGGQIGIGVLLFALGYLFGLLLLGIFSKSIRHKFDEAKVVSLPEFLASRFKDNENTARSVSWCFGLVSMITFLLMAGGQFQAIYRITDAGITSWWLYAVWVVVILGTLLYVIGGGLRRDIISDVIQVFFVIIGMAVLSTIVIGNFSWVEFYRAPGLPTALSEYGIVFYVGAVLAVALSMFTRYDYYQRIVAANSDGSAKWSMIVGGALSLFAYGWFAIVGFASTGIYKGGGDYVIFNALNSLHMDAWIVAVVQVALVFAIASTLDTFVGAGGMGLARMFNAADIGPNSKEKSLYHVKAVALLFAFAAMFLGIYGHSLVDLFVGAFTIPLVLIPSVLYAMFGKKILPGYVANSSIIAGIIVFIGAYVSTPKEAFAVAFSASLLAWCLAYLYWIMHGNRSSKTIVR